MRNPDEIFIQNQRQDGGWITSIEQKLTSDFYSEDKNSASASSLQIGQSGNFLGSLDGTKIFPQIAITGLPRT